MITLIGHGYIGDAVSLKLYQENIKHNWISHSDDIPEGTTVVINAAGYTGYPNVDTCEHRRQDTIDGNVTFPLRLEEKCKDIPVIHISSGCVYTGYKEGGWLETDAPNFNFKTGSFYSGSKALAQALLAPYLNKSYLLRIRMPFGDTAHPKNFLTKMTEYEKLISFDNSLSYINDVADVAIFFAKNLPEPGIYNVCNPGYSNAKEIVEMMGIKKAWFTEEEFNQAVLAPRSNCILNVDKLMAIYPLRPVKDVLQEAINRLKGNV